MATTLNEFNNQPISVLQNNLTTIHGIFAFLKNLNEKTRTRYAIISYEKSGYINQCLDDYYEYEGNSRYWSQENHFNISIVFDSPFLLSGYAISNGVFNTNEGNSYPKEWRMIGVDMNTGQNVVLDTQKNQKFCEDNICKEEVVKGYRVKKSYKAFKEFIFEKTNTGGSDNYLFMKSIDLFGTLCGKKGQCDFHYFQLSCGMKKSIECSMNVFIFDFMII